MEEEKRDGPWRKKRGTVLEEEKEGRSLEEEKRDGPWRKKRGTVLEGTVLEEEKEGRSLEEEKKRDGPWRKRKRGTDLKELKVRTVKKIKKKIKRTLHKEKKIV